MDCPVHGGELLFPHDYDKTIGYCKRCKRWYEFELDEEEE